MKQPRILLSKVNEQKLVCIYPFLQIEIVGKSIGSFFKLIQMMYINFFIFFKEKLCKGSTCYKKYLSQ